jgi:hypothetical protein
MGKGFTEMTVAELRAFLAEPDVARHAASMNITHNTKTRKDELIEIARRVHADMITDRRAAESDTFMPVDETDLVDVDLDAAREALMDDARASTRAVLPHLENITVMSGLDTIARFIGYKRIVRARKVEHSHMYGMNGRGMGAKHFPMRSNNYSAEIVS